MDWEKYTGKKSTPRETRGPLNEVTVEKKPGGEWKIVQGPVEYVDDHTVLSEVYGIDPVSITTGNMSRTLKINAQDDLEVFVGAQKVYPTPAPEPLPSFDEVWETIAAELDRKFNGQPMTPGSVCEVIRTSMRIMYETLTQDQNGA